MRTVERLRVFRRGPSDALATSPGLEDSYRHLFLRELETLGERDIYFPVGGAANYSLLYLILRVALAFHPPTVLDVGCGQTTLLWDRLRKRALVGQVWTAENDSAWATQIGAAVSHPILLSDLRATPIAGAVVETYDWSKIREVGPFSVVTVDGPFGRPRRSRAGVLALLDDDLPQDFILIMDDAERPGERETVGLIHRRLIELKRVYAAGVFRAAKTQVVFATGAYRRAAFF